MPITGESVTLEKLLDRLFSGFLALLIENTLFSCSLALSKLKWTFGFDCYLISIGFDGITLPPRSLRRLTSSEPGLICDGPPRTMRTIVLGGLAVFIELLFVVTFDCSCPTCLNTGVVTDELPFIFIIVSVRMLGLHFLLASVRFYPRPAN